MTSVTVTPASLPPAPLAIVSYTFLYEATEDRVLLALNTGRPNAAGCWMTRRLALAVVDKARAFLAQTSPLAARAAAPERAEVVRMERQVAVAGTKENVTETPKASLQAVANAPLVTKVQLSAQGDACRFELWDRAGRHGVGICSRNELQGILHMLEQQMVAAGWLVTGASAEPAPSKVN